MLARLWKLVFSSSILNDPCCLVKELELAMLDELNVNYLKYCIQTIAMWVYSNYELHTFTYMIEYRLITSVANTYVGHRHSDISDN